MKSPAASSVRAKAEAFGKAAVLALAVVAAVGGSSRGQETGRGQETSRDQETLAPANETNVTPQPVAPARAEAQEKQVQELYGPQKPEANGAIRAALAWAAAQPLPPEQRALLHAVDAFYADHGDAPIFFVRGQWTAQARGVFERLQKAPEDGLDLRAWRVYSLDAAPEPALAKGEVALAQAVAAYAFQASGGRIALSRLTKLIGLRPAVVSASQALEETAGAADADAQLASYNPQHPGYLALREKLGALRAMPAALLAASEPRRRASDAQSAMRVAARATGRPMQEADLLVNMEFWRWLPRDLGADRIMVNVPEYMARLYRGQTLAAANRIVVGKPDTPTPLFSNRMEFLVVNPSWYVPRSIIENEMGGRAPAGYEASWEDGALRIRQPPGERNALGRIKFIFPNPYAVYMHDTPARNLFSNAKRAYSHGCMRVDQPLQWAVAILGAQNGWTEQRIQKMYGKGERRVNLPAPLPIHIGYFTETVDETGELRRFDDIYGYAAEAKKLLGLGG